MRWPIEKGGRERERERETHNGVEYIVVLWHVSTKESRQHDVHSEDLPCDTSRHVNMYMYVQSLRH